MKNLDATNRKILTILQNDGSITNSDLARKLGLSPASTLERVKKLERNGYINGYVALVDAERMGKNFTAFIEVTMSDHSTECLKVFMDAVMDIPEIMECYHVAGDKDFILKVVTDDIKGYEELAVEKIANIPYIGRINTMIVLSAKKSETAIPCGV